MSKFMPGERVCKIDDPQGSTRGTIIKRVEAYEVEWEISGIGGRTETFRCTIPASDLTVLPKPSKTLRCSRCGTPVAAQPNEPTSDSKAVVLRWCSTACRDAYYA